jgi:hypothetical protein
MADDEQVSQTWLNRNAQGIVERQTAAYRDCEAAEDSDAAASLMNKFNSPTVH